MPDSRTLSKLPPEVIAIILLELDWQSILRTQQICRAFYEIVSTNISLQYAIELGIAGMVDGPVDSPGAVGERLSRLKLYQKRWRKLSYTGIHSVRAPKGHVWELASGVLAQGTSSINEQTGRKGVSELFFSKQPSDARGEMKRKEWAFDDYEFSVRDFTMDPSQDLLVLMHVASSQELVRGAAPEESLNDSEVDVGESPHRMTYHMVQLHLRSLSTNSMHPEAKLGVLTYPITMPSASRASHVLSVCQDKICLLHRSNLEHRSDQLVVWNWKEAEKKFSLEDRGILSFSFLTDNHLLFAVDALNTVPSHEGDQQMRLLICDIEGTSAIDSSLYPNAYAAVAELHLPPLEKRSSVDDVLIRSDPPPCSFSPHPYNEEFRPSQGTAYLDVPFAVGPRSRLFVISISVFASLVDPDLRWHRAYLTLTMFVPLSTFLPYLRQTREPTMIWSDDASDNEDEDISLPKRHIAVEWEEWVPNGTRMLILPEVESVWVCNVFGMKYVYAHPQHDGNRSGRHVVVLDFNAANVRRSAKWNAEGIEENDVKVEDKTLAEFSEDITYPSTLSTKNYKIFLCDVTTRLPYRIATTLNTFKFDGVMVTEDNIILVKRAGHKEYGVLTF